MRLRALKRNKIAKVDNTGNTTDTMIRSVVIKEGSLDDMLIGKDVKCNSVRGGYGL